MPSSEGQLCCTLVSTCSCSLSRSRPRKRKGRTVEEALDEAGFPDLSDELLLGQRQVAMREAGGRAGEDRATGSARRGSRRAS